MPPTINIIQNILVIDFNSPKKTIPIMATPTAPIAVHIAYAVPIGMSFNAKDKKNKLAAIIIIVTIDIDMFLKPSENFSDIAQPISEIPAMIRNIQGFINLYYIFEYINLHYYWDLLFCLLLFCLILLNLLISFYNTIIFLYFFLFYTNISIYLIFILLFT